LLLAAKSFGRRQSISAGAHGSDDLFGVWQWWMNRKDLNVSRRFLRGRCLFYNPIGFQLVLPGNRFTASLGVNLHIAAIEQQRLVKRPSSSQLCDLSRTRKVHNLARGMPANLLRTVSLLTHVPISRIPPAPTKSP
jgi:hypothetical protein